MMSGCESVKSGLNSTAAHIDAAFGVEPAARYDQLSDEDVALAAAAMQQALETHGDGEAVQWENTESGNSGTVTPTATFVTDKGVFCREYRETVAIADQQGASSNTSCREDDGNWTWVL